MDNKHYYRELYNDNPTAFEKEAFDVLVNDLLRDNKMGAVKQRTLSGMDMESRSPARFVPTMFYTFIYVSKDIEESKEGEFYDRAPLIFCTKFTPDALFGLNMNLLPNDVRAEFLDVLVESYRDFYKDESSEDFRINEKLATVLQSSNLLRGFFDLLKQSKIKFDLNQVLRVYKVKNIFRSRLIEMDMWKYIPFLNFKDSVRGINLAKLQVEGVIKSNVQSNK